MADGAPLSSILVAGGGLAGWGFAGLLARALGPAGPAIRVLEAGDSSGQEALSTPPAIRDLHARLGLAEAEVVRRCSGSFKLGERFLGWSGETADAFLPYGAIGADIGPVRFHQQLARLAGSDDAAPHAAYALAAVAARERRFAPPARDPRSIMSTLDYGLHLDARAHAQLIEEAACRHGVERLDGRIGRADRDARGNVRLVELEDGRTITADFWIDAAPGAPLTSSGWQDWQGDTPFDRTATICVPTDEPPAPFTTNTARAQGWLRDIPLGGSRVRQFFYASSVIADDAAADELGADGARFTGYATGYRPEAWQTNCLTIGPAAWRTDVLANADVALLVRAAERFLRLMPHADHAEAGAREYNRLFRQEISGVRDFALVFPQAQARTDPLWQACRETPKPETLAHILALFKSRGRIARGEGRIHDETRWIATLLAMGVVPHRHDPQADALDLKVLGERSARIRSMVEAAVAAMPAHAAMLDRISAGEHRT